jgi:hypothetical protein
VRVLSEVQASVRTDRLTAHLPRFVLEEIARTGGISEPRLVRRAARWLPGLSEADELPSWVILLANSQ